MREVEDILMNKRIVSMIQELSKLERIIYISTLADQFSISQRTVRNDLNAINDLLKEYDLECLRLEKGGLVVRGKAFGEILNCIEEKDFYDYKLSKEERKKIASVLLISSSGFITLSEIADYMAVSRSTIINDLDEVKKYIHSGNMKVHSHPNKGLTIDGKESDKRIFLMKLISYNPETANEDIVRKQVAVEEETRIILNKILCEQERVYESYLDDTSFHKIVVYLEIMMSRILHGEYVEKHADKKNSKYVMAQGIMKYVEQYCNISITEEETQFLSEVLSSAHYMRQKNTDKDSIQIQMATREFIESVSDGLQIDLNRDYEFFENLSNHLESTFAEDGLERNPVIDTVAEENQEVSFIVKRNIRILSQCAGRTITDAELGYIIVHVCAAIERKKNQICTFRVIVACHAGIGTSHLLIEKLKKHFNFEIIDIVSAHEAGNIQQKDVDFVISTVPLKECKVEHITVSPLLKDEDYIKIGNLIDRLRRDRKYFLIRETERKLTSKALMSQITPVLYEKVPEAASELVKEIANIVTSYFKDTSNMDDEIISPDLYQLLPASHIQLNVKCKDWRHAVYASAVKLLELGYIEERYIDAMIRNIEENGPYVVLSKGFAFPHEGVDQGTKKLGMNLIRLTTPIEFDADERDPVEFVCCLSAVDSKTHLKAFFHLVNMLKKEEFKEALRNCQTEKEMAEIIRKFEENMEEE